VIGDVGGDRERLDQRGLLIVHGLGHTMNVADGHTAELGKAAVAMHPEHLQLRADIRPADRAGIAAAAGDHGIDHHALANARVDAGANRIDAAEELVADHRPRLYLALLRHQRRQDAR
jgi:hypothetical protein